jgi:hypothetical protein
MYLFAIGMIFQGAKGNVNDVPTRTGMLIHFIFSPLLTPIILGMLVADS